MSVPLHSSLLQRMFGGKKCKVVWNDGWNEKPRFYGVLVEVDEHFAVFIGSEKEIDLKEGKNLKKVALNLSQITAISCAEGP